MPAAALRNIREQFDAGRADEDEVNAAIRAAWRESGDLIDPHTAVAVAVSEHALATPNVPNIVLSTAHAAKFPDAVEAACGARPALPAYLGGLMTQAGENHADAERSRRAGAFHPLGEPGCKRTCRERNARES